MLVYGDAVRRERSGEKLARLQEALRCASTALPGLGRHTLLVSALLEAGELVQGVADAAFHRAGGRDEVATEIQATLELCQAVAGCCARSWSSGFSDMGALPAAALWQRCAATLPETLLEIKLPEGYAFYALYPEGHYEAARRCPGAAWRVIGIRSIGSSLACIVAVALEAPTPITLRPVGHPFERRIAAAPGLMDGAAAAYAIVDEGPGLSGSSMAAVAEWLALSGVKDEAVHFLPSHGNGPGPEARPQVRRRWASARVHVASFDEVILQAPNPVHRLETWVADLVGPLLRPLRDIGAGGWRDLPGRSPDLPPVHPWQERRKFLAETAGSRWLVKFAGLGHHGEAKLHRARQLFAAGLGPEAAGLCHGFIVERWRDDLPTLPARLPADLRPRLLARLARYLGFRAANFAAPQSAGASLAQLQAMGRHNIEEAFGPAAAGAWAVRDADLAALTALVRPVETDNRLQAWEWRVGGTEILKTDALDHAFGHDLIGCQDIAWDVAGSRVEFELTPAEVVELSDAVAAQSGRAVDARLVAFLTPCYLAFQLGYYQEAKAAAASAEAAVLDATIERYGAGLKRSLGSGA